MADARIVEEALRFKFYSGERFCLAYNKGSTGYGDFYLSRPNFYPVYSPSGRPVTVSSAYRFNHHRSIFIGHANVNGVNFFHDNNPERNNLGDIVLVRAERREGGGQASLQTENRWASKAGAELLFEKRGIVWTPGEAAHVLDIFSELEPRVEEAVFGKDTHSYIGIRVADTMDVEDGGRAVNSLGEENEEGAMNRFADWVDYSGPVAGKTVGAALIVHPDNPPSPFFVRNYGTFLSNFTLREPYVLKAGERLTQRFRIVIHEGGPEHIDLDGYCRSFAAS